MIRVENLSLTYEQKPVFSNLSFSVKEGTITLLAGASGSGKSSLLMAIIRMIPDSVSGELSGKIFLDEEDISDCSVSDVAGRLGYVFQDPESQLCTFSVENEISFGLENFNTPVEEIEEKVVESLSFLEISAIRFKNLNELSGGEQQKVAISSVFALHPEVLLLDEPTANMDPKSKREFVRFLKDYVSERKCTVLVVEHNIRDFEPVIDEVVLLSGDQIHPIPKSEFYKTVEEQYMLPKRQNRPLGEAVLVCDQITFGYEPGKPVLSNIDLSVREGEIVCITGCNGAGKSTLTKLIMGLIKEYDGSIKLLDSDVRLLSPKQIGKQMGIVFQNPEHQFIMNDVERELGLSLSLSGLGEKEIREQVDYYLKRFDLDSVRESNPFQLSQGQKRRLSTAGMMINGQRILILDEPTYGQDPENLRELIDLLYEINESGVTLLMITHDSRIIDHCCDRVILLEKGQITFDGEPSAYPWDRVVN